MKNNYTYKDSNKKVSCELISLIISVIVKWLHLTRDITAL